MMNHRKAGSDLESQFENEFDRRMETADVEEGESQEQDQDLEFLLGREVEEDGQGAQDQQFAEKFYELSLESFEVGDDADRRIGDLIEEMEREYFWGGLKKAFRKIGGVASSLAKKGLRYAKKYAKSLPAFQALKGVTQLARGDLKGMLGTLARAGLPSVLSAIPGGAAALPALKAIGFESAEDPEANRQGWDNFVTVARESFEHLATNLTPNVDNPEEASRLAGEAFRSGLRSIRNGTIDTMRMGESRDRVIRLTRGSNLRILVE